MMPSDLLASTERAEQVRRNRELLAARILRCVELNPELTQAEVGARLGCSQAHVGRVVKGQR